MSTLKKIGIYIHIPFCEKKCDYCDFLSMPSTLAVKEKYMEHLREEMRESKECLQDYEVQSVFFGGGTPSAVPPEEIVKVMDLLKEEYKIDCERCEITMEMNPGTLSVDKLKKYKDAGINRISMGLQSAHNDELKKLGRIHTYEQFLENYKAARSVGFTNINIDLMSGLPHQTVEGWEDTLSKILALNPEHISAYSLIIEEGTKFYERFGEDKPEEDALISDETDREIYHVTRKMMHEAGYERYEISNYAKKGYECRHNVSYWIGTDYVGFGLGASSYIKGMRYHNEEDLDTYIKDIDQKVSLIRDSINLTENNKMEEYMFLGLRLIRGVSMLEFEKRFGKTMMDVYGSVIDTVTEEGLLTQDGDRVYLTERGIDLSNYVMAQFLL
ncbi:hypothetical radical SAM family enzyme in heat shock gene cluster, similarity with CPO of BS HemN-type [Lachnospiraceae bacterium KM106-2]|nr:hypothetical radical SAM family enzyme in heat shock gene cluster, similarity with CPO of BS HemN-type [Lachnospiraceae bacterium KM106-2]